MCHQLSPCPMGSLLCPLGAQKRPTHFVTTASARVHALAAATASRVHVVHVTLQVGQMVGHLLPMAACSTPSPCALAQKIRTNPTRESTMVFQSPPYRIPEVGVCTSSISHI